MSYYGQAGVLPAAAPAAVAVPGAVSAANSRGNNIFDFSVESSWMMILAGIILIVSYSLNVGIRSGTGEGTSAFSYFIIALSILLLIFGVITLIYPYYKKRQLAYGGLIPRY